MEQANREGWSIVALDLNIDTTTATGELIAHIMASLAQWERRIIGQRTREALAVKRSLGVRLGRPATMAPADEPRPKPCGISFWQRMPIPGGWPPSAAKQARMARITR